MLGPKVAEQAEMMRDQINLYLDRARMAARVRVSSAGSRQSLPVAEPLVRVLERINKDRGITIEVACPDAAGFQGEKQDLEEMLGNLLDNACKWASQSGLSHGLHGAFARTAATEATLRPDRR